jgi:UDP-3-O-[3-hydroxymyristoyl] N-acetylglucosamine deacetylase/3-hydroxyacyl-[acyl-carrier-protein] dehydratase
VPRQQRTIREPVELTGRGLFSGRQTRVRLLPADPSSGFLFVRTDLPDSPVVPATVEALGEGFRCTTLNWNNVEVKVTEHLLAACTGLQVDNLMVELDGDELPALSGSAASWADALKAAGIEEQKSERAVLELEHTLAVSEGASTIVATPAEDELAISYVLEFEEGYRPPEAFTVHLEPERFVRELASARTFGFDTDYEQFKRLGLGGGVTDENTFILCHDGTVQEPISRAEAHLRFPNEAVRHKIADFLGDIAVINADLHAKVVAVHSGHRLNAQFAGRLMRLLEEERPEEYLDVGEIIRVLPHRYPFLMVDRIVRIEGERKIVGLKNVSVNEHYFQGHYPAFPLMPGVLQLEALAQTAGVLLLRKLEHAGKLPFLVRMDGVKLRRPVRPGDQLILEAEAVRVRSRSAAIKARATVDGDVACEAEMSFMLVDADAI